MKSFSDSAAYRTALRGAAFDLDGTLLRTDHSILPEIVDIFAKLSEEGVWITLASARPPRSVRGIAQRLNLPGPFVSLNGAAVVGRDGSYIALADIRKDLAHRLIDRYRSDPRVSLNVYTVQDWFATPVDERVLNEAVVVGFEPDRLPLTEEIDRVAKILLMVDIGDVGELLAELTPYQDDLQVATSAPTYIEITTRTATKAHGLSLAAETQGLLVSDLLVAGDGLNDLPMLRAAGYGIAMRHAPAELREAATLVVGSNDDGSLAKAVGDRFSEPSEKTFKSLS